MPNDYRGPPLFSPLYFPVASRPAAGAVPQRSCHTRLFRACLSRA
nr:MAG TPA: hypothetical protein [Caudoviricetes sp.]